MLSDSAESSKQIKITEKSYLDNLKPSYFSSISITHITITTRFDSPKKTSPTHPLPAPTILVPESTFALLLAIVTSRENNYFRNSDSNRAPLSSSPAIIEAPSIARYGRPDKRRRTRTLGRHLFFHSPRYESVSISVRRRKRYTRLLAAPSPVPGSKSDTPLTSIWCFSFRAARPGSGTFVVFRLSPAILRARSYLGENEMERGGETRCAGDAPRFAGSSGRLTKPARPLPPG